MMKRLVRNSLLILVFSVVLFLGSQVHKNIQQSLFFAQNHTDSPSTNSVVLNSLIHEEPFEKEGTTIAQNSAN